MDAQRLETPEKHAVLKNSNNDNKKYSRPWREPPLVPNRAYSVSAPIPVVRHSQAATRRFKVAKEFAAGERCEAQKQAQRLREEPRADWRTGGLAFVDDGDSSIGSWQEPVPTAQPRRGSAEPGLIKRKHSATVHHGAAQLRSDARMGSTSVMSIEQPKSVAKKAKPRQQVAVHAAGLTAAHSPCAAVRTKPARRKAKTAQKSRPSGSTAAGQHAAHPQGGVTANTLRQVKVTKQASKGRTPHRAAPGNASKSHHDYPSTVVQPAQCSNACVQTDASVLANPKRPDPTRRAEPATFSSPGKAVQADLATRAALHKALQMALHSKRGSTAASSDLSHSSGTSLSPRATVLQVSAPLLPTSATETCHLSVGTGSLAGGRAQMPFDVPPETSARGPSMLGVERCRSATLTGLTASLSSELHSGCSKPLMQAQGRSAGVRAPPTDLAWHHGDGSARPDPTKDLTCDTTAACNNQQPALIESRSSAGFYFGRLGSEQPDAGGIDINMPYLAVFDPPPVCHDTTAVRVLLAPSHVSAPPFGPPLSHDGSGENSVYLPQYGEVDVPRADRLAAHSDRCCITAMSNIKVHGALAQANLDALWEQCLLDQFDGSPNDESPVRLHTVTPTPAWADAAFRSAQSPAAAHIFTSRSPAAAQMFTVPAVAARLSIPDEQSHSCHEKQHATRQLCNQNEALIANQDEEELVGAEHACMSQYENTGETEPSHVKGEQALTFATREVEADLSIAARLREQLMSEVKNAQDLDAHIAAIEYAHKLATMSRAVVPSSPVDLSNEPQHVHQRLKQIAEDLREELLIQASTSQGGAVSVSDHRVRTEVQTSHTAEPEVASHPQHAVLVRGHTSEEGETLRQSQGNVLNQPLRQSQGDMLNLPYTTPVLPMSIVNSEHQMGLPSDTTYTVSEQASSSITQPEHEASSQTSAKPVHSESMSSMEIVASEVPADSVPGMILPSDAGSYTATPEPQISNVGVGEPGPHFSSEMPPQSSVLFQWFQREAQAAHHRELASVNDGINRTCSATKRALAQIRVAKQKLGPEDYRHGQLDACERWLLLQIEQSQAGIQQRRLLLRQQLEQQQLFWQFVAAAVGAHGESGAVSAETYQRALDLAVGNVRNLSGGWQGMGMTSCHASGSEPVVAAACSPKQISLSAKQPSVASASSVDYSLDYEAQSSFSWPVPAAGDADGAASVQSESSSAAAVGNSGACPDGMLHLDALCVDASDEVASQVDRLCAPIAQDKDVVFASTDENGLQTELQTVQESRPELMPVTTRPSAVEESGLPLVSELDINANEGVPARDSDVSAATKSVQDSMPDCISDGSSVESVTPGTSDIAISRTVDHEKIPLDSAPPTRDDAESYITVSTVDGAGMDNSSAESCDRAECAPQSSCPDDESSHTLSGNGTSHGNPEDGFKAAGDLCAIPSANSVSHVQTHQISRPQGAVWTSPPTSAQEQGIPASSCPTMDQESIRTESVSDDAFSVVTDGTIGAAENGHSMSLGHACTDDPAAVSKNMHVSNMAEVDKGQTALPDCPAMHAIHLVMGGVYDQSGRDEDPAKPSLGNRSSTGSCSRSASSSTGSVEEDIETCRPSNGSSEGKDPQFEAAPEANRVDMPTPFAHTGKSAADPFDGIPETLNKLKGIENAAPPFLETEEQLVDVQASMQPDEYTESQRSQATITGSTIESVPEEIVPPGECSDRSSASPDRSWSADYRSDSHDGDGPAAVLHASSETPTCLPSMSSDDSVVPAQDTLAVPFADSACDHVQPGLHADKTGDVETTPQSDDQNFLSVAQVEPGASSDYGCWQDDADSIADQEGEETQSSLGAPDAVIAPVHDVVSTFNPSVTVVGDAQLATAPDAQEDVCVDFASIAVVFPEAPFDTEEHGQQVGCRDDTAAVKSIADRAAECTTGLSSPALSLSGSIAESIEFESDSHSISCAAEPDMESAAHKAAGTAPSCESGHEGALSQVVAHEAVLRQPASLPFEAPIPASCSPELFERTLNPGPERSSIASDASSAFTIDYEEDGEDLEFGESSPGSCSDEALQGVSTYDMSEMIASVDRSNVMNGAQSHLATEGNDDDDLLDTDKTSPVTEDLVPEAAAASPPIDHEALDGLRSNETVVDMQYNLQGLTGDACDYVDQAFESGEVPERIDSLPGEYLAVQSGSMDSAQDTLGGAELDEVQRCTAEQHARALWQEHVQKFCHSVLDSFLQDMPQALDDGHQAIPQRVLHCLQESFHQHLDIDQAIFNEINRQIRLEYSSHHCINYSTPLYKLRRRKPLPSPASLRQRVVENILRTVDPDLRIPDARRPNNEARFLAAEDVQSLQEQECRRVYEESVILKQIERDISSMLIDDVMAEVLLVDQAVAALTCRPMIQHSTSAEPRHMKARDIHITPELVQTNHVPMRMPQSVERETPDAAGGTVINNSQLLLVHSDEHRCDGSHAATCVSMPIEPQIEVQPGELTSIVIHGSPDSAEEVSSSTFGSTVSSHDSPTPPDISTHDHEAAAVMCPASPTVSGPGAATSVGHAAIVSGPDSTGVVSCNSEVGATQKWQPALQSADLHLAGGTVLDSRQAEDDRTLGPDRGAVGNSDELISAWSLERDADTVADVSDVALDWNLAEEEPLIADELQRSCAAAPAADECQQQSEDNMVHDVGRASDDLAQHGWKTDKQKVCHEISACERWEQEAQARQQRAKVILQAVLQEFCADMPEFLFAGEPVLQPEVVHQVQQCICWHDDSMRSEYEIIYDAVQNIIQRRYDEVHRLHIRGQLCHRPEPNPKPLPTAGELSLAVHDEVMAWLTSPIQPLEYREFTSCSNEQWYLDQDTSKYLQTRERRKNRDASALLQEVANEIFDGLIDEVVDDVVAVDELYVGPIGTRP